MNKQRTEAERVAHLMRQKYKLRRIRLLLVFPLLIECFILLLLHPGFFGGGVLCDAMTNIANGIEDVLRFRGAQDEGTYRYYIDIVCTWIEDLPFYPLLAGLAPWVLPGWIVLTIVQSCVIKFRMNHRPKIQQAPMVSGLYEADRKAAIERFNQLQQSCDNPFLGDQGVRVQSKKDFVVRWDENGNILLQNMAIDDLHLYLRNGQAYLQARDQLVPLRKGVPVVIRRDNRGGESITQCAITWLGDD